MSLKFLEKKCPILPMCATSKECVQVCSEDEKDGRGERGA